jgi:polyphenol oxidase
LNPRWFVPDWPVPPGVRALSTYRSGGASAAPYAALNLGDHVGDEPGRVADNRKSLAAAAALPSEPRWLAQVHGTRVANLDSSEPHHEADAAVTALAGTVCAILTADCLPILLASDSGERVGAAHAGWRGLAAGVIEATVEALSVPGDRVLAWLGPAIGARHFEVGAEVREALLTADLGAADAFVPNSRGRFMADLNALARRRLSRVGVERVYVSEQCTYASPERYFSHRRDGTTGRQASLIWIEAA